MFEALPGASGQCVQAKMFDSGVPTPDTIRLEVVIDSTGRAEPESVRMLAISHPGFGPPARSEPVTATPASAAEGAALAAQARLG
jgi:hypothetical protein